MYLHDWLSLSAGRLGMRGRRAWLCQIKITIGLICIGGKGFCRVICKKLRSMALLIALSGRSLGSMPKFFNVLKQDFFLYY
ncbi:hypothetical protein B1209_13365 [Raoultella planticola]|nr:hypothetical protein CRT62_13190 [Raoultella planticola]ATM17284.1 hypothetical protein CRN15_21655 [Raoultella planticola]AUU06223.1 hypothetical protein MC50_021430 [Raoultella planticola]AUV53634.1 hypothetical protein B1209_13365 [Raoultella planticola]OAZ80578.1 hypothetical protein AYO04_03935 [Raoultella planticola]